MIVSNNPREDRAIKTAAAFMLGLMVAFLGLVTCRATRPDANWHGPFGTISPSHPYAVRHIRALTES